MSALTTRRIMSEYRKLKENPEPDFVAAPLDDNNLFNWHFIIKGPKGSPFEGGLYHGELLLPSTYPAKPPDIIFRTPNGRFQTNTKICLTFTSFHPEQWTPSWNIRTILTALIAFFPTKAEGAVGGIDRSDEERRRLAEESRNWHCDRCTMHLE